jgi:hypothetical protein
VFAPPLDPAATELILVFPPSRGRVLRVECGLRDGQLASRRFSASTIPGRPNAWRFPLEQVVSRPVQPFPIRLTTLDEPLRPIYFVEELGSARRVSAPKGDPTPSPRDGRPSFTSDSVGLPLEELLLDAKAYAKALMGSLDPKDPQDLRRYFVLLERASNPEAGLIDAATTRHVDVVTPHLRRRVRYRAMIGRIDEDRTGDELTSPPPALRRSVEKLSKMQLQLVDACFQGSDGKFDGERFHRAFQAFANGELRHPVRIPGTADVEFFVTQPSSAYYLFFAEFAFLACECKVDEKRWSELANAMTYTQRIFAKAYSPSHRGARFRDFVATNFHPDKRMSAGEIGALRKRAEGLDLAGLRALAADTVRAFVPRHAARFA